MKDVGLNWTRTGFLRIAERMGAVIVGDLEPPGTQAADEPIGELDVAAGPLEGTVVEPDEVPLAIDELTLVALLGAHADGETVVRGAEELRLKESDGSPASWRGCAAWAPTSRPPTTASSCGATARRSRAARSRHAATTGWRCSAPWPGWRPRRGSTWWVWTPPRCRTPGSSKTSAPLV